MKTFVLALGLSLLALTPLRADVSTTDVFAGCAGRLSAEMEHAWLLNDPSETLSDQRETFISLLNATTAEGDARRALAYRIEAKLAHSSLLTLATFGTNQARADEARRLAIRHLHTCQRMLLDS